eukprot:TRINITY_DN3876_c0_g2_i1.p1 TRINITY_DN3876_c0_g2~~TRINITY_DN3876_c0_g2_i1.p1  ORF type:complete len:108 (+),score=24.67 TRINITY_DN3876_c0_g2_i1:49-324(+)
MAVGNWVDTRMWMGPALARTGLHYDVDPISILHQIQGTKRVLLYQPTDLPYVNTTLSVPIVLLVTISYPAFTLALSLSLSLSLSLFRPRLD